MSENNTEQEIGRMTHNTKAEMRLRGGYQRGKKRGDGGDEGMNTIC